MKKLINCQYMIRGTPEDVKFFESRIVSFNRNLSRKEECISFHMESEEEQ